MSHVAISIFLLGIVNAAFGQFFGQQPQAQTLSFAIQPPPVQQTIPTAQFNPQLNEAPRRNYAHRAVEINAEHEAQLPANLLNPFYKNPRISEALAKESWITPEEMFVQDREAEKISRQKIYSVLKNAGFVNRRRR